MLRPLVLMVGSLAADRFGRSRKNLRIPDLISAPAATTPTKASKAWIASTPPRGMEDGPLDLGEAVRVEDLGAGGAPPAARDVAHVASVDAGVAPACSIARTWDTSLRITQNIVPRSRSLEGAPYVGA